MEENYEINRDTLIVMTEDFNQSKIITKDEEIFIKKGTLKVINYSCCYYGSSYRGRFEGSKNILKTDIKLPVIIEESNNIIFFPTKSSRLEECMWISYNNLEKYEKNNRKTKLYFYGGKSIEIEIPYNIIDNQIVRCIKLEKEIQKRKKNV